MASSDALAPGAVRPGPAVAAVHAGRAVGPARDRLATPDPGPPCATAAAGHGGPGKPACAVRRCSLGGLLLLSRHLGCAILHGLFGPCAYRCRALLLARAPSRAACTASVGGKLQHVTDA